MNYLRFWLREVAGWLMVLLGLFGFYICFALMVNRQIFEAWWWPIIAIFTFRGGIHLIKVATAAQVCLRAQQQIEQRAVEARPIAPRSR